jgi:hypothetical protein
MGLVDRMLRVPFLEHARTPGETLKKEQWRVPPHNGNYVASDAQRPGPSGALRDTPPSALVGPAPACSFARTRSKEILRLQRQPR